MSPLPMMGMWMRGILLHLADERPVGLAGVHLRPGASVDGQGLDAAVLQLFGQGGDDAVSVVPSQAGLHGHGRIGYGIDHGPRDFQHQGNVLQHAGSGALAGHALHGAAEVDVENVGVSLLDYDLCCIAHGLDEATVNLYGHGALVGRHFKLFDAAVDVAHKGVRRHEFRIDHVGPHLPAEQTEADVRDVLHGRQKDGVLIVRKKPVHTSSSA